MTQAQTLDALALPLIGERLIEASAGTGKTFTIAALYLRLLLGLGGENAYPRPLSVEEILVVTFTEAATEELRGRIRSNIHDLRLACVRGNSTNPLLSDLLDLIDDKTDAVSQLLAAERQMDEAAIYTIHGFCQRMLSNNAFESGILFQQTLVQDELPLRRQACADFWRRHCYPLPLNIAAVVSQEWSGPEQLLSDLQPYLHGELPELRQAIADDETLAQRHQQIIERIDAVKSQWCAAAGEIESLIADSGVDKRSYSSRYLPKWLAAVGDWSAAETQDYQLPDELKRFGQNILLEKTKKGTPPQHAVFVAIDQLLVEPLSLRDLLLSRALSEVRTSVQQEKRQHAQLGFDDLLSRLSQALQQPGGEMLAQAIRQRYPVAMIDEFQDTDPQQYGIFQAIYVQTESAKQSDSALLLIGDPKQAIYAFRGADIFTYMYARSEVKHHYTLGTNWRSSPGMVAAVNRVFSAIESPFLFEDIPFLPVEAAKNNQALRFEIEGQRQQAMHIWLQSGEGCGTVEYQQSLATQCAAQIRDWLMAGQQGKALLYTNKKDKDGREIAKPVEASDITILVRSRAEAALIRDALSALAIPSVYLSNRDNVFETPEARDLLWLLQAVLAPEQERLLRSALATSLMGLNSQQINHFNQDERLWDALVDEFDGYRQRWQKQGVLPMLREIMVSRNLAENLLASEGGERRLTDVLHIGELLQEASLTLDSGPALLRWLAQQIDNPAVQSENQQLRLESDRHLVQVVTIHKSKGLEFPIVWLPFIGSYRQQKQPLYHDRDNFKAVLDLNYNDDAVKLAEEERLAEDLRLLYVALTRSVYHCSLGLAPLFLGGRKKQGETDVHNSAIGYLLQKGEPGDAALLLECLQRLQNDDIVVTPVSREDTSPWVPNAPEAQDLQAKLFTRKMQDDWRVTSYSGLQQHSSTPFFDLLPKLDVDAVGESDIETTPELTPHTFPKGAAPGTFLHSLLEPLDFTQPRDLEWLSEQVTLQGLDDQWVPVLDRWLEAILRAPLAENGPCLAQLPPSQIQAELQFYLPIEQLLKSVELDALIKRYDPLSAQCDPLDFRQVRGMLKGFIDLVFFWQGRYYVLDYKSNWLGADENAYTPEAMAGAMAEHRYDFQYQLYSLALHRYLRHRLPDYQYEQHFGGVFYCFLRGMSPDKPGQGVFHCRPDAALIEGMDKLFSSASEGATC